MIVNEEIQQPEPVSQGPGKILRQARERAKLSTQDIAEKIKLKRALIEDIELDNFDINISLTFVRGYLKLYAKHVHVEETEVLNAFEKLSIQEKEPVKLQGFSRKVVNQSNDDKLMLVTYIILAAIIALVVIYWFQQSSTNTTASNVTKYPETIIKDFISQEILTLEQTLTSDAPTLLVPQINENKSSDDSNVTAELITDNQSVNLDIVSDTSSLALLANTTETSIIETTAPVELIFEFSGDCWMLENEHFLANTHSDDNPVFPGRGPLSFKNTKSDPEKGPLSFSP
jgi:cytoskeleton protein RodZ